MAQIDFYSGASDKLLVACRLSEKVIQQALKIMIYIPDLSLLNRFDKLLWTFSPTSFIPHCHVGDRVVNVTPVILIGSSEEIQQIVPYEVLLNLHDEVPLIYDRFQRVIEIVGNTPEDKVVARKRYRFYQEQGLSVYHHKLGQNLH
ncbi:DNA polymerase III subunit chi [Nitrosomonas sp. Is37]|uniref:DNA polymerase III subunit chi n=1 Tax=Nitrosomonas sp. Is37 TaxID=3080535 RepID=UPI00294B5EEF|nr:DNA polymerase III subunit chi [Nitrosomonas sp. Is37]MDV6345423.1 DNA polymerase III subunit chi [Nitrosomonas sp. Is37]